MDKLKIILENGVEKEVNCYFFLYNLKYYFMYTEKEIDENGYVIFYLVEVGKEIKNTADGQIDTGFMVGVELNDDKIMQQVVTKIVEGKKSGMQDPEIQYLPLNMISTLKIISRKTFRLMKNIVEEFFKLDFQLEKVMIEEQNVVSADDQVKTQELYSNSNGPAQNDVIIDYRTKFFEEQEKNKELSLKIDELTQKIEDIKKVIQ